MNIIWIFCVIALAGLVMLVFYAIWMCHKAADLTSELSMMAKNLQQISELASQIKLP
ncbi:MAG: hypothetical protein ACRDAX_02745 [Propionibacteriaceae bacterium]